jgi:TonB-dependent SusC/RagA subfamily outer membrane receptor
LENVSVHDVASIDVFKNASSAAIFGMRGGNGVISITTKRGMDMINEIESVYGKGAAANYTVYTPLGYQKPIEFYSPKYETLEAKKSFVPDYRTTIFWKPDIIISDTGEASFEFYASDFPTTYSVVIEGLTNNGKTVRRVEKIKVE